MKLFIENKSNLDFTATCDNLKKSIADFGWKMLISHDLQAILKNKGIDVLAVEVIEICNPKFSSPILKNDDARMVSCMMPCRISVYEKSDGTVIISRMNAPLLAGQMSDLINTTMTDAFEETEQIILNAKLF